MSKLSVAVLIAVFATVGLAAQATPKPTPKTTPKAAAAKETRLEGVIVRQSQADSTLTVHRRWTNNEERTVVFNSATKWTKLNKPAEMSIFKDGQRIIVLGKLDDKGRIVATRIDLRSQ
jgi:cytochrome c-type biogenesis protein CcmE